uniref:No apical meristem-associated C-terminal domain-containing protein n=1 Tax=Tanacetum cinerariifolium TaxID=118510 RepID=A0A6L2KZW5_TANCI|nr:hypothetical protein [Tanacetum cinerariifolium]
MTTINAFPVEKLYSPQFSDSFQANTGYWQEPNPHESPVEQVLTSSTKTKKPTRSRQRGRFKAIMHPGRLRGQLRNTLCWLKVGLPFLKTSRKESGAGDEDYINRAMIHYQIEIRLPFKYRHCWDVLKDCLKWKEIALPKFTTESEGVEVREIRRRGSKDKARAAGKNKGSKASGSSTMNDDALARLMIPAQEYRQQQEDIRFYLQPYDHLTGEQMAMDEAKAKIKAKFNLQY